MPELHHFAAQGRFILAGGQRWIRDFTDEHRAREPKAGTKTAGWLVGHLSVTGDFGRKICGLTPICSKEWRAMFNPGSQPSLDVATYPPMDELRDTMRRVYEDLFANGPLASAELLAMPNPYTPALKYFETAGEFAAYLMTGHLGHHMGQVATWHATAGLSRGDDS